MAAPSGDLGEWTSIGDPLSSREASRKVTSSSSFEPDRDRHARADHAVGAGRAADARVLQYVLQDDDPRLDLALLVLGRVVPAVLAQVAFFPGRLDLLRDIDAPRSGEVVKFGLEPVVRL